MAKRLDLVGQRFGRLVVISLNEEITKQKKNTYWNCKCDCGNEKVIRGDSLRGGTISCGCYQKEKTREMVKEKWQDEEYRQKQSNKMKKLNEELWKDEEFRQMHSDMLKEQWKNEEYRQMKSNELKTRWQDEEYRQMRIDKVKEQWQNEEFRQKQSNKMKKFNEEQWKNEEYRQMKINEMSGDSNPNWQGGITPISTHLRSLSEVKQWKKDTYIKENNKCQLTGIKVHRGNSDVHHLKAFSTIVLEAHELHNIQVKPQIKDYTEEELHKLEEYVASWHKDTSNAVVLSEEVHKLFHSLYGQGGNTPEQFEEFRERYMAGEFKGLI